VRHGGLLVVVFVVIFDGLLYHQLAFIKSVFGHVMTAMQFASRKPAIMKKVLCI